MFLWFVVMVSIVGADYLHQDPNHTCQSDDDCQRRLPSVWGRGYHFVCCTSVLCDEMYGNYYLVHSGCATARNCRPKVQSKQTTFAARLLRSQWDTVESSVVRKCPITRERLSTVLSRPSIANVEQQALIRRIVVEPPPPPLESTSTTIACNCSTGIRCCIVINCRDTLQVATTYYRLDNQCRPNCPLYMAKNVGTAYQFYIDADLWHRESPRYEREERAPPVASSCRETRYFVNWMQQQQSTTPITIR